MMQNEKITDITDEKLDDVRDHLRLGREFLTYQDIKVILELIRKEKVRTK